MKISSENYNYLICISLIYRASHIFCLVTLNVLGIEKRPKTYGLFWSRRYLWYNQLYLQADMTFLCPGKFDPSVLTLESVVL